LKKQFIYVFIFIISLISLLLVSNAALAASKSAKLTADEVRYNDETRQIEALGHVSIIYDDTAIQADYALIDQDLDAMLATGEVHLVKDGDSFQGQRLLYYFKSKQGWLAPVNCEITDSEIEGKVYLSSNEAFLKGEDIVVKQTQLTSCDLDHPHYHFSAQEVEYYPGERIILHKVWYWEGKLKLLYFRKLSISLHQEDENNLEYPVIGYNDTVGWFMRWGYNYFRNPQSYGRFYFEDITERGGDGIGLKHTIKPTATSLWYQDYYYQDREDMGYPKDDFRFGYGYENWTNPKLKYQTNLQNWHRFSKEGEHYTESTYRFNLIGQSPYPTLTLKINEEGLTSPLRTSEVNANWSYRFDNSFDIRTNMRWQLYDYLKEIYSYQNHYYYINAIKNWEKSSLQLDLQTTQSLSQSNFSYRNLLPELTYRIPKWNLPLLGEVDSSFQYTRLEKVDVSDGVSVTNTGTRWATDFNKMYNLWTSTGQKYNLNLDSQYHYRYFEVDEEESDIAALSESINLGYKFTDHFSTTVGLGYTERMGPENSDFFSKGDNYTPGGFLTNRWAWVSTIFSANLATGYSFYTQAPQTVYFSSALTPGERQRFSFSTEYLWEEGLGATTFDVDYNPRENWKIKMGLGYDFRYTWTKKEFQSFITQQITKNWRVELNSIYDSLRDDMAIANFALVYDWHCRDVRFYYDHIKREYWVQLAFKAFPQASLKLSSNPEDYLYWIVN
jgi:hypothetical protein